MTDTEPTVKGSWPLVRLIDGVPHWYIAGTNPPQYAPDEPLEQMQPTLFDLIESESA